MKIDLRLGCDDRSLLLKSNWSGYNYLLSQRRLSIDRRFEPALKWSITSNNAAMEGFNREHSSFFCLPTSLPRSIILSIPQIVPEQRTCGCGRASWTYQYGPVWQSIMCLQNYKRRTEGAHYKSAATHTHTHVTMWRVTQGHWRVRVITPTMVHIWLLPDVNRNQIEIKA